MLLLDGYFIQEDQQGAQACIANISLDFGLSERISHRGPALVRGMGQHGSCGTPGHGRSNTAIRFALEDSIGIASLYLLLSYEKILQFGNFV